MFSNLGEMIPRELPGDVPWLTEIAPDGAERTLDFARFRQVAVRRLGPLSPRLVRVTLAGDELDGFTVTKPAASVREREARHREAIQYSLQRGSRSGRVAWQFARGHAGARAIAKASTRR